jgi:hypothetical protein
MIKGGVKLDFLDIPDRQVGKVPFDDEVEGGALKHGNMVLYAGSLIAVVLGAWIVQQILGSQLGNTRLF